MMIFKVHYCFLLLNYYSNNLEFNTRLMIARLIVAVYLVCSIVLVEFAIVSEDIELLAKPVVAASEIYDAATWLDLK